MEPKQHDRLFSIDIAKGYHHFRLHPKIRNWFLFKFDERHFRCVALCGNTFMMEDISCFLHQVHDANISIYKTESPFPHPHVHGRILNRHLYPWEASKGSVKSCQPVGFMWSQSETGERLLGRFEKDRTSRVRYRHPAHGILASSKRNSKKWQVSRA